MLYLFAKASKEIHIDYEAFYNNPDPVLHEFQVSESYNIHDMSSVLPRRIRQSICVLGRSNS